MKKRTMLFWLSEVSGDLLTTEQGKHCCQELARDTEGLGQGFRGA